MKEYVSVKSCFLIYRERKAERQCSMSMTKYGTCEEDGIWSIKWMRCTMVDEINEMDYGRWNELDGFGLWTQQRWSGGKTGDNTEILFGDRFSQEHHLVMPTLQLGNLEEGAL